jgi:N-acyl-D-aspartate/D-glutamate deacylase
MATDLLGRWVRDRGALPLPAAVRKLTGEPADVYSLDDRGYVREGSKADIAVFDPDTVGPGPLRRVRDFPADGERLVADAPEGMTHVIVNGTPIRVDGEPVPDAVASKPGRVLRG